MKNRILFVDDDKQMLDVIERTFKDLNIVLCQSPIEGLKLLANNNFDIVVADYKMPEMDGLEFLRYASKISPDSIRIILTGNADLELAIRAVNEGSVFRFLEKTCDRSMLKKAIYDAIGESERARIFKEASDINYFNATHDSLTGLANRHLFKEKIQACISNWKRYKSRFAIFYMDLDKFKPVNDTYGHIVGDEILKEVATRLIKTIRTTDTVARFGGDEFVLLAENIKTKEETSVLAEKIIQQINLPFFIDHETTVDIGISIGISIFPDTAETYEKLIEQADTCVYKTKDKGGSGYTHCK